MLDREILRDLLNRSKLERAISYELIEELQSEGQYIREIIKNLQSLYEKFTSNGFYQQDTLIYDAINTWEQTLDMTETSINEVKISISDYDY